MIFDANKVSKICALRSPRAASAVMELPQQIDYGNGKHKLAPPVIEKLERPQTDRVGNVSSQ